MVIYGALAKFDAGDCEFADKSAAQPGVSGHSDAQIEIQGASSLDSSSLGIELMRFDRAPGFP